MPLGFRILGKATYEGIPLPKIVKQLLNDDDINPRSLDYLVYVKLQKRVRYLVKKLESYDLLRTEKHWPPGTIRDTIKVYKV